MKVIRVLRMLLHDMAKELGDGNKKPEILPKLAQYELTLLDWVEEHRGYRKYVAIAGKCWPAFQTQFGFVPCYVNSRLTGRGIPVSCEVDIYGCLSEFIGTCVSDDAVTLLDINNTVPYDLYSEDIKGKFDYSSKDVFMGFHCGNTCSSKLSICQMKYQKIMARSLPVEVTNGTLEGDIAPGISPSIRLQSTADNILRAYVAEGESSSGSDQVLRGYRCLRNSGDEAFLSSRIGRGQFPASWCRCLRTLRKGLCSRYSSYIGVDARRDRIQSSGRRTYRDGESICISNKKYC